MRYVYTVEFTAPNGYRHLTHVNGAPEAIRIARALYAALYVTTGEGSGGIDPKAFGSISDKACQRVTAEPGNRAFCVAIAKRAR